MNEPRSASDDLYREALDRVKQAIERASQTDLYEPTAGVLATAGNAGWPTARTVLLKGLDEAGALFYTNLCSRKAQQLSENPRASLCFFWQPLAEQVEICGSVVRISAAEADEYWAERPRDSQIGGWASDQSQPLESRRELEERAAEIERRFPDRIPRPPHWSGYRLVPVSIELWRAGEGRLHERERYELHPEGWERMLLNP
ncbi:pyridoxamine 5'-phosphate oxidase [Halorhodospira halochloris]|uniref:Pyridoxine/pyridoxamine 5'-phosphate oxidase n=1 Tax=Halorhodospira halochloris TaxID=1052 RepID=A0A0X8X903_HALHR|nr:pyridoxamine 5'-phosphate oxidase [Halorhodospira halochloris]MBK1652337.1 pyridoxamine 5'-phosphate oxidase [Halorhodospira halochloris]MCG5530089.1 pyridoxamine 5'-phosphate oxidase [Halorhodospira halochloris]MCG5548450.1 pyridoxamine 5'-phosphate oxidase [Halorhodospira halochloris]BAU57741.1 pyridoxamine 5'-phosphate oxidase [Halorhodospira halochloris]